MLESVELYETLSDPMRLVVDLLILAPVKSKSPTKRSKLYCPSDDNDFQSAGKRQSPKYFLRMRSFALKLKLNSTRFLADMASDADLHPSAVPKEVLTETAPSTDDDEIGTSARCVI